MCGRPSEIVVLIVKDEPIIDDFLRRLKMPATPYLRVGDERHFYFQKPAVEVGFAIAIGPLRLAAFSDGSTVFGAGSIAPTGAVYEWSISPGGLPFAELPEPLVVTGNHMLGTQIDERPEEDAGAFLDIAFIAWGDIMYPCFGPGGAIVRVNMRKTPKNIGNNPARVGARVSPVRWVAAGTAPSAGLRLYSRGAHAPCGKAPEGSAR